MDLSKPLYIGIILGTPQCNDNEMMIESNTR